MCEAKHKRRRVRVGQVNQIRARRGILEVEGQEVSDGQWPTSVDVG